MTPITESEIQALIEKARRSTHIARGAGNVFFRPAFTAGSTSDKIRILESKILNAPMSEFDFEFYSLSREVIPQLCEKILELRKKDEEKQRTEVFGFDNREDGFWILVNPPISIYSGMRLEERK